MKTVHISILLIFISISGFAQTKILFDATKAEMAGNADWIIDADQSNLFGNESNPQQMPTPAQADVTSSTSQNYWKGALSAWAIDAVKLGYYVETLPYNGKITYGNTSNLQDLIHYDVFVVCEPNILFTTTEKTAIMNFVQNGGGLFMISDHNNSDRNSDGYDSPDIWNDFMENNAVQNNPFGITFDYEYFTEATSNIPNSPNDPLLHGNYGDVTSIEFYGGTSITLNPSQNAMAKGVVYRTGYTNTGTTGVLCAYASYGQGKVVALGDSSPADDGTGDTGDDLYDGWIQDANGNHERLIMNATIWLAQDNTAGIASLYTNPNIHFLPTTSTIRINTEGNNFYNLRITNILGQDFLHKKIQPNQNNNVKLEKNTLYFYQIKKGVTIIKTGKFVII